MVERECALIVAHLSPPPPPHLLADECVCDADPPPAPAHRPPPSQATRAAGESERKVAVAEHQLVSLRKELEAIRKAEKDRAADGTSKDVRLNRALEEAERYKALVRELQVREAAHPSVSAGSYLSRPAYTHSRDDFLPVLAWRARLCFFRASRRVTLRTAACRASSWLLRYAPCAAALPLRLGGPLTQLPCASGPTVGAPKGRADCSF